MSRPIGTILPPLALPPPEAPAPRGAALLTDLQLDSMKTTSGLPRALPGPAEAPTHLLTPVDQPALSSIWTASPQPIPWELRFQYSAKNADATQAAQRGGGLVVGFCRRRFAAEATPPAGGSPLFDGSGYAVQIFTDTESPRILLGDGTGDVFTGRSMPGANTAGGWRQVVIRASRTGIDVAVDGLPMLRWSGSVDASFDGLVWAGASQRSPREHQVRALELRPLDEADLNSSVGPSRRSATVQRPNP